MADRKGAPGGGAESYARQRQYDYRAVSWRTCADDPQFQFRQQLPAPRQESDRDSFITAIRPPALQTLCSPK